MKKTLFKKTLFRELLKRLNYFFIFSWVIIFCALVFMFPALSFHSQLWAEQGTNFLANAMKFNFLNNLLITDAGYIAFLPRLITLLVYNLFPLRFFPYVTNLIALGVVAFCLSFFCLNPFRKIISSDKLRFTLSILLACGTASIEENYTFINFSYYGVFYCLFIIFYDKKSFGGLYFLFSILTALFCFSKFHFTLFLPLYMCVILHAFYKRDKYQSLFFIIPLLAIFMQLLNVLCTLPTLRAMYPSSTASIISTLRCFVIGVIWYMKIWGAAVPLFSFSAFIIFVYVTYYLWRRSYLTETQKNFLLATNYVTWTFLSISALNALPGINFLFQPLFQNRYFFIPCELIFLSLCVISEVCKIKSVCYKLLLFVVFVVYMLNFGGFYLLGSHISSYTWSGSLAIGRISASDWNSFYQLFAYPDYFIPVNPGWDTNSMGLWSIRKNCEILIDEKSLKSDTIDTSSILVHGKSIRAVYIEYPRNEMLKVEAYDNFGNILSEGIMINAPTKLRKYILFREKVSPSKIVIKTNDNNNLIQLKGGFHVQVIGG